MFEFLDKHLRGTPTPDRPPVEFYLQAANKHVSANRWPPARTRYERLDLGPSSLRRREGRRSKRARSTGEYVTNPAAGLSLALNKYGTVAATRT